VQCGGGSNSNALLSAVAELRAIIAVLLARAVRRTL